MLTYVRLGRYSDEAKGDMLKKFCISVVETDDLRRGGIVRSVVLQGSDEGDWYLWDPHCDENFAEPVNR